MTEAAINFRDSIYCGPSHRVAVSRTALIHNLSPLTVWAELKPEDIGFVTTRGRFVSRAEAWVIAKRAGQLRWDRSWPGVTFELRTEDLKSTWNDWD